jgi:hypothetical protein
LWLLDMSNETWAFSARSLLWLLDMLNETPAFSAPPTKLVDLSYALSVELVHWHQRGRHCAGTLADCWHGVGAGNVGLLG